MLNALSCCYTRLHFVVFFQLKGSSGMKVSVMHVRRSFVASLSIFSMSDFIIYLNTSTVCLGSFFFSFHFHFLIFCSVSDVLTSLYITKRKCNSSADLAQGPREWFHHTIAPESLSHL